MMASTRPLLSYNGKLVMAPMVRVGNLAFRVVCAKQGADILFTEETIAVKLVKTTREVDEQRGLVEYTVYEDFKRVKKRNVVFSTIQRKSYHEFPEGAPVILQLGACDPDVAASAAAHVEPDVDGVDLNMGCPKGFSVNNGMGHALMEDPAKAVAILTAIKKRCPTLPLSCKMRVFGDDIERSVRLVKACAETGVHAVSLHFRTKSMNSEEPPLYEFATQLLPRLREVIPPGVSLIWNGDIKNRADMADIMAKYPVDGCMIARYGMWNPTNFNRTAPDASADRLAIFQDIFRHHIQYQTSFPFVKYHMTRTFQEQQQKYKAEFTAMQRARDWEAMAAAVDLKYEGGAVPIENVFDCDPHEKKRAQEGNDAASNTAAACDTSSAAPPSAKEPATPTSPNAKVARMEAC